MYGKCSKNNIIFIYIYLNTNTIQKKWEICGEFKDYMGMYGECHLAILLYREFICEATQKNMVKW
jgi:hypothetical protein